MNKSERNRRDYQKNKLQKEFMEKKKELSCHYRAEVRKDKEKAASAREKAKQRMRKFRAAKVSIHLIILFVLIILTRKGLGLERKVRQLNCQAKPIFRVTSGLGQGLRQYFLRPGGFWAIYIRQNGRF
jgi:hypothetical protein